MAEAYSWTEGTVHLWTGTTTPGTLVAYAENVNVRIARGWENIRMLGGNYVDRLTGLRVDVSVGLFYTNSSTLTRWFESATAIHAKFNHSAYPNGSAGFLLYSGRLDSIELVGSDSQIFKYTMAYHANAWSAYGG